MKTVQISWKKFKEGEEPICGHGILFLVLNQDNKRQLIAFIDGFDWYHGRSDEMHVWICSNSEAVYPKETSIIHQAIQNAASNRDIISGKLSDNVIARVHG
jgi:hypothetical protein